MEYVTERRLLLAFEKAADFLVDRMREDKWKWSSNFLREYARCSTDLKFPNSHSTRLLKMLGDKRPDLKVYLDLATLR